MGEFTGNRCNITYDLSRIKSSATNLLRVFITALLSWVIAVACDVCATVEMDTECNF